MKYIVNYAILGVALVYGLGLSVVEPLKASAQDRTSREVNSEIHLPGTKRAAFKVPSLWEYTAPLIAPEKRNSNPSRAQKDPTVVFYGGKWHVFMTVKLPGRSAIEYCSFKKWEEADRSQRSLRSVIVTTTVPRRFSTSPRTRSGTWFTRWVCPMSVRCG